MRFGAIHPRRAPLTISRRAEPDPAAARLKPYLWVSYWFQSRKLAGLKDTAPPALDAAHDALFLDLDGTLVEIADDPAQVRMDEAARAMLGALAKRAGGAVAVLTGRT